MTNHSGFFYLLMSALFPQTHSFLLIFPSVSINQSPIKDQSFIYNMQQDMDIK